MRFQRGGETGNNDHLSKRTQQLFAYVLPPIGGLFMIFWPGGLQLTFFMSAMISNIQATLFRHAGFRTLVGIQPLPDPAAPKSRSQKYPRYQAPSSTPSNVETPKGIFGNVKGAVSDIMKLGERFSPVSRQQAQKGRLTTRERQHAKSYDGKRRREIAREAEMKRGSEQAKFERQQEQKVKEQEKKEKLQRRAEKKAKQRQ